MNRSLLSSIALLLSFVIAHIIVAEAPSTTPHNPCTQQKLLITDTLIDLGIPLHVGVNTPIPGLTMTLYAKVDGAVTIVTELIIPENEPVHPAVARILQAIDYKPSQCSYFSCTGPTASKGDSSTTVLSIKKSCPEKSCPLVYISLRTLLNAEQIQRYLSACRIKSS